MIEIEGLGKRYKLGTLHEPYKTLRDSLSRGARTLLNRARGKQDSSPPTTGARTLWALRDISLSVERGEVLGIIGNNGAGKSTLLKILARITAPTTGRVVLSGRVGSLLEVGTGFHGELTGRENIYLNGAILGMRRSEIQRKLGDILSFAEVEQFADTPVKRYSSGMYLRLAFAVAAHLETEILLVDEVLAVGDARFRKRCLGKMSEIAQQGRTVIFVSHNMGAIASLCQRALRLQKGRLVDTGLATEVVERYLAESLGTEDGDAVEINSAALESLRDKGFKIEQITVRNPAHPELGPRTGDPLTLEVTYSTTRNYEDVTFWMRLKSLLGQEVFRLCTQPISGYDIDHLFPRGSIQLRIPALPLVASVYQIDFALAKERTGFLHRLDDLIRLHIAPADAYGTGVMPDQNFGLITLEHEWKHRPSTS